MTKIPNLCFKRTSLRRVSNYVDFHDLSKLRSNIQSEKTKHLQHLFPHCYLHTSLPVKAIKRTWTEVEKNPQNLSQSKVEREGCKWSFFIGNTGLKGSARICKCSLFHCSFQRIPSSCSNVVFSLNYCLLVFWFLSLIFFRGFYSEISFWVGSEESVPDGCRVPNFWKLQTLPQLLVQTLYAVI